MLWPAAQNIHKSLLNQNNGHLSTQAQVRTLTYFHRFLLYIFFQLVNLLQTKIYLHLVL